jgi:hypothetical protein
MNNVERFLLEEGKTWNFTPMISMRSTLHP